MDEVCIQEEVNPRMHVGTVMLKFSLMVSARRLLAIRGSIAERMIAGTENLILAAIHTTTKPRHAV